MDFVIFWKLISCCILKTFIAVLHCLYYANIVLECCEVGCFAVGLCMFCKRAHSVAEVLILVLFTLTDSVILLLFKCSQVRFSQSLDHWSLWKLCTCAVMHNFIIVVSFQHALMIDEGDLQLFVAFIHLLHQALKCGLSESDTQQSLISLGLFVYFFNAHKCAPILLRFWHCMNFFLTYLLKSHKIPPKN